MAGEDPNWGRVVMALGKSGARPIGTAAIRFGDILWPKTAGSRPTTEERGAAYMKNAELEITVDLGLGTGEADDLDLRPHPRLHLDQRRLPLVKTLLVSAVALIDVDGRVLLAQRPEGKSMAGLWEFPGGKVEPGETTRGSADPGVARRAGHRHLAKLPRPADIRQPHSTTISTC